MNSDNEHLSALAQGTLRLIQEFKNAQNLRTDLDRITFEILMLVKMRGRVRPSDIASELDFNPSSVTRRIQALKQLGQIEINTDPDDLRSSLIGISPAGEAELTRFLEHSVEGLKHILGDWKENEIRVFAEMLGRYSDSMRKWRVSKLDSEYNPIE
ncbi:MarR family winged helix-turn-helix transcriptional regulator [Paenibacillus sp. WQ 127069]|uniref:MarR family winged helix-turn-helix transcriptional regulator n=1 Tax=Paenibacillus baimaensis TaxID=2982185 RepID=A0ABT2UQD7_9BACL|nr:MarR family winged helix-turn-helix transcriptional regulator [Paenibacillus sp. WQ 127069]MCU6796873.1 MarR family winged helix-turn-helix transcriptional regulator [Paenibacillus sp. WQ 127069]